MPSGDDFDEVVVARYVILAPVQSSTRSTVSGSQTLIASGPDRAFRLTVRRDSCCCMMILGRSVYG
jgi:hypothetical protein